MTMKIEDPSCPKCGSAAIKVSAKTDTWFEVNSDGSIGMSLGQVSGAVSWSPESMCFCRGCGYMAKAKKFSIPYQEMVKLGAYIEHLGGGCEAWKIKLTLPGYYLLLTNKDGMLPQKGESVLIGLYGPRNPKNCGLNEEGELANLEVDWDKKEKIVTLFELFASTVMVTLGRTKDHT